MRLTFTGDILVEQEQFNALQGKPYDEIMLPMAEVFSKTDYLIGNLETPCCRRRTWLYKPHVELQHSTGNCSKP